MTLHNSLEPTLHPNFFTSTFIKKKNSAMISDWQEHVLFFCIIRANYCVFSFRLEACLSHCAGIRHIVIKLIQTTWKEKDSRKFVRSPFAPGRSSSSPRMESLRTRLESLRTWLEPQCTGFESPQFDTNCDYSHCPVESCETLIYWFCRHSWWAV